MTTLGTGMLEGGIESALLGLTLGILVFVFLIIFATFVYYALAWMTLGKKLKYSRPWLAWIPFANISMMLQMGGFHWAWVFLVLLPIFGFSCSFTYLRMDCFIRPCTYCNLAYL